MTETLPCTLGLPLLWPTKDLALLRGTELEEYCFLKRRDISGLFAGNREEWESSEEWSGRAVVRWRKLFLRKGGMRGDGEGEMAGSDKGRGGREESEREGRKLRESGASQGGRDGKGE